MMSVGTKAKNKRRPGHQSQWAAQFAVASELIKRGYEVAFTMGNHPVTDLMVIGPKKTHLVVDVKGLHKKNVWLVRRQQMELENLFYIFAFVPDNAPNQFFVLTQKQVNEGIETEFEQAKARKKAKGMTLKETGYPFGVEWRFALQFKDQWDVLPK